MTSLASVTKIRWRRAWDGTEFTGTVVRELPEYRSYVVDQDGTGRRVVVHQKNLMAAAGTVFAQPPICHLCNQRPIAIYLDCPRLFYSASTCARCGAREIQRFEARGFARSVSNAVGRYTRFYAVRPVVAS